MPEGDLDEIQPMGRGTTQDFGGCVRAECFYAW